MDVSYSRTSEIFFCYSSIKIKTGIICGKPWTPPIIQVYLARPLECYNRCAYRKFKISIAGEIRINIFPLLF
jgi:hypothetical protein